jgi:hypothetical protein
MNRLLLLISILFVPFIAAPAQTPQDTSFVLESSTLSYHMSHPIHEVDGVSHAARGKGNCHAGNCDFLLAAPVKSFDSGDSNRDLHMLQVVRGGEFPIVTVRFRIPENATTASSFNANLDVTFAGNTDHYYDIPFRQEISGRTHRITGIIPTTLSGFKIPPPEFLGVAIKNEIPVRIDTTWQQQ